MTVLLVTGGAAVTLLVAALVTTLVRWPGRRGPERPRAATAAPTPDEVPALAPPRPPPARAGSTGAPPADGAPSARLTALAGGRPIAWWQARLRLLAERGERPLFEATVRRAEANGLVVVGDGVAVRVEMGAQLARELEEEQR